jgi:hypothetical protein
MEQVKTSIKQFTPTYQQSFTNIRKSKSIKNSKEIVNTSKDNLNISTKKGGGLRQSLAINTSLSNLDRFKANLKELEFSKDKILTECYKNQPLEHNNPNYILENTNDNLLHKSNQSVIIVDQQKSYTNLKFEESCIQKHDSHDSILATEHRLPTRGDINKPTMLILKDDILEASNNNSANNLKESNSSMQINCRICYEGGSAEKGSLIFPCHCIGSVKYIHDSCLKKWIENNVMNERKLRPECELCKYKYHMKFSSQFKFSRAKLINMMKNLAAMVLIASIILTLIFTVIYVVVTSLMTLEDKDRKTLVNILISTGMIIMVIFILLNFRNCKLNYYDQQIKDWKIYNVDGKFLIVK